MEQTCTLRCRVPPFIISPLPNEPQHDRPRPSLPRRDPPTLWNAICTEKIIPAVPFVVLITRSNHLKLNSFSYYESGADPSLTNQKSISTMQEDEVSESSMRAREREDAIISQVEKSGA